MGSHGRRGGFALLAIVAGGLVALGTAVDTPGDPPELSAARKAVGQLYGRRSQALASGDRAAWQSTVADPNSEQGRQQLRQYDNLRALGISELTLGDIRPVPQSASADREAQQRLPVPLLQNQNSAQRSFLVELGSRIPGFDGAPRVSVRTMTVAPLPNGWRIVGDHSSADQLQLWDLDGLRVQRSDAALVAGNVDDEVLVQRLANAEAGQAAVRRMLGPSVPAVLVVPRTAQEAARQLGRPQQGALEQLAASTDGSPGLTGTPAGASSDRVVLNPDAFARLTAQGRQVVVTHELTHVATRASVRGRVPLWLSEGLAEYVAWEPVRMPVETAAARLLAQVRSAKAPTALPAEADFDPARGDPAAAYQAAWLAVRLLAAEHGEGSVVAFYRAVARAAQESRQAGQLGQPVERAFVSELGTTLPAFQQKWRAHLEQLAG